MDHSFCQLAWSVFFCLLVRILFSFYFGLRLVFFFSLSPCSDIDPSVRRERRQGNDHQSKTRGGESLCRHIALSSLSHSHFLLEYVLYRIPKEKSACPLSEEPYALFTSTAMYTVYSHDNNKDRESFQHKSNLGK